MKKISPSSRPGMGAIPHKSGTTFRVWAPNADRVYVTGSFNNWSDTDNPLAKEAHGYWSADVPEAKPGDQYRYNINNGPQLLSRMDPYAMEVTSSNGNAVIFELDFDWGGTEFKIPPPNELVIYEMHIGTFNDRPGGPPGNLMKAIEKFPYLKALGINTIEVMPVMEFRGGFSWGYNPALIFSIENEYGGPKAFKEFVHMAHAHGLAVIFDVVYNHFGPGDLSLWRFDGWYENDKGGIYFYNDWKSQTPWGDTRPDYGRDAVCRYIRDNALMWLEKYRVDGLRWDATAFIRNVFGNNNDPQHDIPEGWHLMQKINEEINNRFPDKICIAEDIRNNPFITKAIPEGGAGFHAQWDALFVKQIRKILLAARDQNIKLDAVREAISLRFNNSAFERVIYTESHDEVANGRARLPEEISPGDAGSWLAKKLSTLGAALIFTSPGIPMIFQGQEFLEDDWFHDRDPIDWSKKDTYSGILRLYRDLIKLRRNLDGKTRGLLGENLNIHHLNKADNMLAFHRWDNGGPKDDLVIVVNMTNKNRSAYRMGLPRLGQWRIRFNSDWHRYDPSFSNFPSRDIHTDKIERDGMPYSGEIDIAPYSTLVLSQDD